MNKLTHPIFSLLLSVFFLNLNAQSTRENPIEISFTKKITSLYKGDTLVEQGGTLYYNLKKDSTSFIYTTDGSSSKVIVSLIERTTLQVNNDAGEITAIRGKTSSMREVDYSNSGRPSVRATSETDTVNGYACRKYTYSDDDNAGFMWITKDIDVDYLLLTKTLDKQFSTGGRDYFRGIKDFTGFPIKIDIEEKSGKSRFIIDYLDIKPGEYKASAFNVSPELEIKEL